MLDQLGFKVINYNTRLTLRPKIGYYILINSLELKVKIPVTIPVQYTYKATPVRQVTISANNRISKADAKKGISLLSILKVNKVIKVRCK
jgi:hypothetical protein